MFKHQIFFLHNLLRFGQQKAGTHTLNTVPECLISLTQNRKQ